MNSKYVSALAALVIIAALMVSVEAAYRLKVCYYDTPDCSEGESCKSGASGSCIEGPGNGVNGALLRCAADGASAEGSFYTDDNCSTPPFIDFFDSVNDACAFPGFGITVTCIPTEDESTPIPTPSFSHTPTASPLSSALPPTNATATPTSTASAAPTQVPTASSMATASSVPTSTPTDSGECFPADASIYLENGQIKRMDQVEVGDRVLVGMNKYSDVYFFGHKLADGTFDFVQLTLSNGRQLELSKGHLLMANNKWTRGADVKLEDRLLDIAENREFHVNKIQAVKKTGLYNPHTLHGEIVVNGIQASSYTDALHPKLAHLMLLPERTAYLLHRGLSLCGSAFEKSTPLLLSYWYKLGMSKMVFMLAA